MPEEAEKDLVERLKRRDEFAFNELVRTYQTRVYHLVLRMMGDEAEAQDLSQEVFVTVFKSIDGFRGDSKLSTWLYRVAVNHCKNRIKYLNRRARGATTALTELSEREAVESGSMATSAQVARPDQAFEGRQMEHFIRLGLSELDQEQRELVVLRDLENLTYEEIQKVTGLAEGTVKSRLHRARMALHKRVRELANPARESSTPSSGRSKS